MSDLLPGDVRVINVENKKGEIIKTVTVFRTTRPYVEDLCDAYNAARSAAAINRGVLWYVDSTGTLRVGDSRSWQKQHHKTIEQHMEAERARQNRAYLESLEGARYDPD